MTNSLPVLVAILVLAAAALGFVYLSRAVLDGRTLSWDTRIIHSVPVGDESQPPREPGWLEHVARDITALGSTTVIAGLAVGIWGYLLVRGQRREGWLYLLTVASGYLAYQLLKYLMGRDRPESISTLVHIQTHSYPSGHAAMAVVAYLGAALLVARHGASARTTAFALACAVVLSAVIGWTRVYLRTHWPSDVLAGLLGGTCWTLLWWIAGRSLEMISARRIARLDADVNARDSTQMIEQEPTLAGDSRPLAHPIELTGRE